MHIVWPPNNRTPNRSNPMLLQWTVRAIPYLNSLQRGLARFDCGMELTSQVSRFALPLKSLPPYRLQITQFTFGTQSPGKRCQLWKVINSKGSHLLSALLFCGTAGRYAHTTKVS